MGMIAERTSKHSTKRLIIRFLKALFKAAIAYTLFIIFSTLMTPFEGFINHQTLSSIFVVLYIFFIFVIELTRGTVFQHIFSVANSLMFVLYFAQLLNAGVINVTIEQMSLMIDLRFFLGIFVLGGLLGFAKSMLNLLGWMNEREEQWLRHQIKSL